MHLAGAIVGLAVLLLGADELFAHPENSAVRAAREFVRRGAREAARAATFTLCLPVLAVGGIALVAFHWAVQTARSCVFHA